MKVLVTGGTGFVGQAVVRRLCASGHRVRLLVRRPESPSARALADAEGAELRSGDVLDAQALVAACAGMDAVVHLVGIIAESGAQTFENIHAGGTRTVVEAARAGAVHRFVHMSALGTRPGAASRYHQTKWLAEQSVRRGGMAWTIFRPSIIYGPGDGFVSLFERLSRYSPVVPLVGNGQNRLQPVPVEDVANCFALALAEPRAVDQTFDLCGPDPLTLRQILETILRVTGRRRLIIPLPLSLLRVQAALLEGLYPGLLRRPAPLSRDQLLMLEEDNVGDPRAAMDVFGLRAIPFADGLAACVRTRAARE
jgi:NADH dehydrogenase